MGRWAFADAAPERRPEPNGAVKLGGVGGVGGAIHIKSGIFLGFPARPFCLPFATPIDGFVYFSSHFCVGRRASMATPSERLHVPRGSPRNFNEQKIRGCNCLSGFREILDHPSVFRRGARPRRVRLSLPMWVLTTAPSEPPHHHPPTPPQQKASEHRKTANLGLQAEPGRLPDS